MNRIRTIRKAKGLTMKQLGLAVGAAESTVSHWETNQREPDIDTLNKLAEYFNVSIDFLIGRSFEMTIPVEKWHRSLQDDYSRANEFEKTYMEYKYGGVIFANNSSPVFTDEERALGAGQAKTTLSAEEWEWLELMEELKQKKGDAKSKFVVGLLRAYIDSDF